MEIRQFTDQETIDAYRLLRWEVFRNPHNLPYGSELYENEEAGCYIGAFENEELIGGVLLIPRGTNFSQMHHLVVREECRNRGVAAALIVALENRARALNMRTVYAHARVHIRPLYEIFGYSVVPESRIPSTISHLHAPGVPHVMLSKEL